MKNGVRCYRFVMKRLRDVNITSLDSKLLVVVDFTRRFVRLVQPVHTDAIGVRCVKPFDVKRRDRSNLFDVSFFLVAIENRLQISN